MDALPIWSIYVILVLTGVLITESGYRIGLYWHGRYPKQREQAVGSLVGATLALLAFLLVFLVGMASDRFDNRRRLVVAEANAIGTTFLRAGFLPEPYRSETRQLLREYVDIRLAVAQDITKLDATVSRSEAIHTVLWNRAEMLARANDESSMVALYITSVNAVIDVHSERAKAVSTRVPISMWLVVGFAATLTLMMVGFQTGVLESRSFVAVMALLLVFAAVLLLIIDLDRPYEGLLSVSQQALVDLQRIINASTP